MKYLHLSTYNLCWARNALLICRPILDTREGILKRQSSSLDLVLAPWWLTPPGGSTPCRHDTNPGTGLICQSCHLPATHRFRESKSQMGGGGCVWGVGGWIYHVPYSIMKFVCTPKYQFMSYCLKDVWAMFDIAVWWKLTVSQTNNLNQGCKSQEYRDREFVYPVSMEYDELFVKY